MRRFRKPQFTVTDIDGTVDGQDHNYKQPPSPAPPAKLEAKSKRPPSAKQPPPVNAPVHAEPAPPPTTAVPAHSQADTNQPLDKVPGTDFLVLPVTFPPPTIPITIARVARDPDDGPRVIQFEGDPATFSFDAVTHHIYFRPHEHRADAIRQRTFLPPGRTLFLTNLPMDSTRSHLQRVFRRCGRIVRVVWQDDLKLYDEAEAKMNEEEEEEEAVGQGEDIEEDVQDNDGRQNPTSTGSKRKAETTATTSTPKRPRTSDPFHALDRLDLLPFTDPFASLHRFTAHRTGSSAHVVFEDADAVQRATGMVKRRRVWAEEEEGSEVGGGVDVDEGEGIGEDGEEQVGFVADARRKIAVGRGLVGLQKHLLLHHLSRPPPSTLLRAASTILSRHDASAALLKQSRRTEPIVDEDGFTVVSKGKGFAPGEVVVKGGKAMKEVRGVKGREEVMKGGKGAQVAQSGQGGQRDAPSSAGRSQRSGHANDGRYNRNPDAGRAPGGFYKNHAKETRANALEELKRRFEEDKRKVERVKQQRVFKPL